MLTGDLPGDLFGMLLGVAIIMGGVAAAAMIFIGLFDKFDGSRYGPTVYGQTPPQAPLRGSGEHIPSLDNFALASGGWRRRNPHHAAKGRVR